MELFTASEVYAQIERALRDRCGFSLIRCGDGEALVLGIQRLHDAVYVRTKYPWVETAAGAVLEDLNLPASLRYAVAAADLVGIPITGLSEEPEYWPMFRAALEGRLPKRCCDCMINYQMFREGRLLPLLADRRVVFVGNEACRARDAVVGMNLLEWERFNPVRSTGELVAFANAVGHIKTLDLLDQILAAEPELVWIGAGIGANLLAVQLALNGVVALDVGGVLDVLAGTASPGRRLAVGLLP